MLSWHMVVHTQKWSRQVSFGFDHGCAFSTLHIHQSVCKCCEVAVVLMMAPFSLSLSLSLSPPPFYPPSFTSILLLSVSFMRKESKKECNQWENTPVTVDDKQLLPGAQKCTDQAQPCFAREVGWITALGINFGIMFLFLNFWISG